MSKKEDSKIESEDVLQEALQEEQPGLTLGELTPEAMAEMLIPKELPVKERVPLAPIFRWMNKDFEEKVAQKPMSDSMVLTLMERYAKKSKCEVLFAEGKGTIRLEPTLLICNSYWHDATAEVSFKIGNKRMYVLKDIRSFLASFESDEEVHYGKALTLQSVDANFDEKSQKILNFLRNYYNLESNQSLSPFWGMRDSLKSMYLNKQLLDAYIDLQASEKDLRLSIDGNLIQALMVYKNPHIQLKIMESDGFYTIELLNDEAILLSGRKQLYIYENDQFYICDEAFSQAVTEFLKSIIQNRMMLKVMKEDMHGFYNTVLTNLESYVSLLSDCDLSAYETMPVVAKVYFDAPRDDYIMAKLFFHYGDQEHEGFQIKDLVKSKDLKGEHRAEALLKKYLTHYDPMGNYVYLEGDENDMFTLFSEGLSEIASETEVFATNNFKRFKVSPPATVKVGVRISGDLLNLDFDLDGFDVKELAEVLNSYRQAKKYHRLRNGSFIRIEDSALGEFSELADGLNLKISALDEGSVLVPKFRALYLDMLLKKSEGIQYNRDNPFKKMVRDLKDVSDSDFVVPNTLKPILRNYQKTGFRWLKTIAAYGFGGILADDMGLGKTVEVIALLLSLKESEVSGKSLVICPSSLVLNWEKEIERFAPDLKVITVTGTAKERQHKIAEANGVDVFITSYDLLKRDVLHYEAFSFCYEIIDEAQCIKNHTTQNAKSVKLIKSQVRFALTGTPVENSLAELWSIYDFLMPGYLYPYRQFKEKFETPIVKDSDKKALGRLDQMVSPFILRRMKKDVLKELPDKTEATLYAKMEGEQKKLYLANLAKSRENLKSELEQNGIESHKIMILAMLTRLRQICCDPALVYENYTEKSAKLELCLELIETSLESGHKLLLFSQFTSMLAIIQEQLEKRNIPFYKITGKTKPPERLRQVNAFNADATPVFLISLKAGGTGLNLTGADVVIHYDPWWNLSAQNQATDRAHRIGQKNNVQVYSLIAKDTIEEKIQQMQQSKAALADAIIREGEGSIAKMSKAEIIELFE